MKYAIISDIHANPMAFESVLDDIRRQKADRVVCLGDVTGYGYDAVGAFLLAKESCDVWLMGNHDAACAGVSSEFHVRCNPNYDRDRAVRKELGRERLAEIRECPYTHANGFFSCAHGDFVSPQDFGYVLDVEDAWRNFCACDSDLMFVGHTHEAKVWTLTAKNDLETSGIGKVRMKSGCRYLVNVGSVGYPRRDLFSSYALFDSQSGTVDLRRIGFDFPGYMKAFEERGLALPAWLERLNELSRQLQEKSLGRRKLKLR